MPVSISIEPRLLAHPWYRKWECGELPASALQTYAREYYWQVAAFPRYLSRLHSQMKDLKQRQVVLGNLVDEENADAPHPELWLDFAEAMGADREEVRAAQPSAAAAALVEKFEQLVASSPEEGLGVILAYESQVPEVARFKSEALKKFYLKNADVEKGTRFFSVHQEADVWHTQALEGLLGTLTDDQKQRAQTAATQACDALWKFLDTMPTAAS